VPSSTSSFRIAARLAGKLAAVFAVLLASYSVLIWIHPIYATRFIDGWTQNQVLAERLMVDPQAWPRILVGSSMSLTLEQAELGDDLYNLSFARIGGSNGLEIIRRLGLHPREVIIEINMLQEIDTHFVGQLFDALLLPIRRWVPAFRSEYRPVNLVLNWSSQRHAVPPLESPIVVDNADPGVRTRWLAELQRLYDRPLTEGETRAITQDLRAYVDYLTGGGTKVTFLEMPMDPRIAATASFRARSETIRKLFPPDRYRWIDLSSAGPFETRDGVHLLHVPAVKVARLLRQLD
jgi:hypothetical protein